MTAENENPLIFLAAVYMSLVLLGSILAAGVKSCINH